MLRMSEEAARGTAVALSAAAIAAGAIDVGVHAGQEAFGLTPEERNAQVVACASQLGPQAVRTIHMPDACEPFETSFAFERKLVTVRANTHVPNGLPAYTSWYRKDFDVPSADAFRQAKLEPISPDDAHKNPGDIAAEEGALSASMLLLSAAAGSMLLRHFRRRKTA